MINRLKENHEIQKSQQTTDTVFSITNQLSLYRNLSQEHWPLIPFMLINYIATNYLSDFIRIASKPFAEGNMADDILNTSCIHTAFSILNIFFGQENANLIMKRINMTNRATMTMRLPSGIDFTYKMYNTFADEMIREMNKEKVIKSNDVNTKLKTYIDVNSFFSHNNIFIKKKLKKIKNDAEAVNAIKSYLSNLSYSFSKPTIKALKKDISNNKLNLSASKSYIYFIAITAPDINKDIKEFIYDHAFLIEQFYPNKFRIYQSWIKSATLLEDFAKRRYDESDSNTMNEKDINELLDKIDFLLDPIYQNKTSLYECFGYYQPMSKLLRFDGNNKISATNLRYYASEVSPQRCIDNFIKFLDDEPEFTKPYYNRLHKI